MSDHVDDDRATPLEVIHRLREERDAAEVRCEQADKLTSHTARDLNRAIRDLANCFRLTGSDPEGDDDARLASYAVQAVKELRKEGEKEAEKLEADAKYWEDRALNAELELMGLEEKLDKASKRAYG